VLSRRSAVYTTSAVGTIELVVVRHIAAHLTNRQIGERMFISAGSAKIHLSHVFAKLGIPSCSQLVADAPNARSVRRAVLMQPSSCDETAVVRRPSCTFDICHLADVPAGNAI
jgi:hypothetical protein